MSRPTNASLIRLTSSTTALKKAIKEQLLALKERNPKWTDDELLERLMDDAADMTEEILKARKAPEGK